MKTLLLLVVLGNAADMSTSLVAFHYGATEMNPLVVSTEPVPFIIQGVVMTAGEVWALNKLSKKHPKVAKVLSYISIGASVGASINNTIVIRKQLSYQG